MANQSTRSRNEAFAALGAHGIRYETAAKALRQGRTIQRLAEAECNGDYPADNGERKVAECKRCQGLWVPSVMLKSGLCPSCRIEDSAKALAEANGATADVGGDPRGAVLAWVWPDGTSTFIS
jgi:hypothetical protein